MMEWVVHAVIIVGFFYFLIYLQSNTNTNINTNAADQGQGTWGDRVAWRGAVWRASCGVRLQKSFSLSALPNTLTHTHTHAPTLAHAYVNKYRRW